MLAAKFKVEIEDRCCDVHVVQQKSPALMRMSYDVQDTLCFLPLHQRSSDSTRLVAIQMAQAQRVVMMKWMWQVDVKDYIELD